MTLNEQWLIVEREMLAKGLDTRLVAEFKSIFFMGCHAALRHATKGGDLFDYSLEVDTFVKTEVLHDEQ